MRFKTTDLLVTVLPRSELRGDLAKVCLLHTKICRSPTFNCSGCSVLVSCIGCSTNPTCYGCSILHSCGACSVAYSCFGCSVAISHCGTGCSVLASVGCGFGNSCGPGGSACDPTYIACGGAGSRDPIIIEHLEDLIALKADLQDTLKQLEALQKEGSLTSSLGSKADAEALEKSLTEALDQVRATKKTLK
jgi:hypothetical protein